MAEPYIIIITSEADFDGSTLMTQTVNDFAREGRSLSITVPGAVGVIPSTFFGLFSGTAPKLVGVATDTWNPLNTAQVQTLGVVDAPRQIATLRPQIQHLNVFGNDTIAVRTRNGGRSSLYLSVNALSESEHVDLALRQPATPVIRRFRIRRPSQSKWTAAANMAPLAPVWSYESSIGILAANIDTNGPLPVSALCLAPDIRGCYVRVRVSGSAANNLVYVLDGEQRRVVAAESGLVEMEWSKVIYLAADDHLMFATDDPVVSLQVHVEIEVVSINPRDPFVGRYDAKN